ncbi:MAG: CHASE2 domain-containing protein [Acidobacteria bacterium]|nr:CHASE2 domain-containing protein [Acidobacteriota bacterium]
MAEGRSLRDFVSSRWTELQRGVLGYSTYDRRRFSKYARRTIGNVALVSAIAWGTAAALHYFSVLEPFELLTFDTLVEWRNRTEPPRASDVAIVTVGDEDMRALGHETDGEVTDDQLACGLLTIAEQSPNAIGVDVLRGPEVSELLGRIITAEALPITVGRQCTPLASGSIPPRKRGPVGLSDNRLGCADFPLDQDGRVRRALLVSPDEQLHNQTSFDLMLAKRHLPETQYVEPVSRDEPLILGSAIPNLPDAGGFQIFIDYLPVAIPTIPFRCLASGAPTSCEGSPDPSCPGPAALRRALEDKVVLIGYTGWDKEDHFRAIIPPGLEDCRLTAFNQMPGVYLHAHVVAQLLRLGQGGSRPIMATDSLGRWTWVALWVLLGAVPASLISKQSTGVGLQIVILLSLIGAVWYAFVSASLLLPFSPALVGWLTAAVLGHARYERLPAPGELKLFLSYSRDDRELASQIEQHLARYFRVWKDESSLRIGTKWQKELVKAISESDVFLAIVTRSYVRKCQEDGPIRFELQTASADTDDRPIIPVRAERVSLPASLEKLQWADLTEPEDSSKRAGAADGRSFDLADVSAEEFKHDSPRLARFRRELWEIQERKRRLEDVQP